MSDTPRTDAAKVDKGGMTFVWLEFAQGLELELAISLENQCKAQAEVDRLRELLKRAIENAETACRYLDTGGWNEDEMYSGKDGSQASLCERSPGH